jgi:hypothetical protein
MNISFNRPVRSCRKSSHESCAVFDFQARLRELPHSRQHVSWRGVMSPQNGHIRCEAKSPSRGAIFNNFLREAAMKARRLRTRTRNGCSTGSMVELLCFLCRPKRQCQVVVRDAYCPSDPGKAHDDTPTPAILCRIAHIAHRPFNSRHCDNLASVWTRRRK